MKMPEYDELGNITNARIRELDIIVKEDIKYPQLFLSKLNRQYMTFEKELRMNEC